MAGIYIHIPFCKKACTYCNFHFSTRLENIQSFVSALRKEIETSVSLTTGTGIIESIYFGGGTPSLLSYQWLDEIFSSLNERFTLIAPNAEITLEANPDDISMEKLMSWKKVGINRLSLGIQSFDEEELSWMNRAHNAKEALASLVNIRDAGYTNYSADLIYGSPLLTDMRLRKNIDLLLSFDVPHISAYALTVEPKTVLYKLQKENESLQISDEKQAAQFAIVSETLKEFGYDHYEISNFAKPGYRSRHNSSYWQGQPYYGFGPSAHSYNGTDTRSWNVANNALYIKGVQENLSFREEEVLTIPQQVNETVMTQLRTTEGVSMENILAKFGKKHYEMIINQAAIQVSEGNLIFTNHCLVLTDKGKFLADGISVALFV